MQRTKEKRALETVVIGKQDLRQQVSAPAQIQFRHGSLMCAMHVLDGNAHQRSAWCVALFCHSALQNDKQQYMRVCRTWMTFCGTVRRSCL